MATRRGRPEVASVSKVVLAQAFELDGLFNVLGLNRVLTNAAVLEEIKRLRQKTAKTH